MERSLIPRILIGIGGGALAALSALALAGGSDPSHWLERRGPACAEPDRAALPGFGAFPPGGTPACIRLRIG